MRTERNAGQGHALVEYLALLLGLMVVWGGVDLILSLLREHQAELSWAFSLPL